MPDVDDDLFDPPAAPKLRKVVRGAEKLKGVQPDLINHWNNLQTEFDKAGLVPEIKSGFRTQKNQQDLYNNPATRARTKGNDGVIKISPHQEGRALDISFNAAQRGKGREIIANYAKQNNLHVPSDEPWHISLSKAQKAAVATDDLFDAPATDDDLFDAPKPAQVSASATARAKPNTLQVGAGVNANIPSRAVHDAIAKGMGVTAQMGRQTTRPLDTGLRTQDTPTVNDINKILTDATHSPEAEARSQIRQQVTTAREKQRQSALGRYGGMIGTPQIGLGAVDVLDKAMSPVSTLRNLTKTDEQLTDEEVERQREAQKRATTPEQIVARQEFGEMSAPRRAVSAPAARFGAGMVKSLAGVTSGLGIAPNQLSEYLNKRGQSLEEATSAPLDAAGKEVVRGIPEKVVSAVGDLGFGIAQIVGLKKLAPGMSLAQIMAVETALKTSEMPVAERADAIAHATVMGEVLDGHLGRLKSAAVFGVPTAIESGSAVAKGQMSPEDALLNTAVQTASGFALGGKPKGDAAQMVKDGVPEKPSTLTAQLEQRGYTLVPEGSPRPSLPRGTRAEKTADGTVYYDPKRIDAKTIRSTPTAELLGHVEPKSETTTEAVVARAPDGSEIQSSAVSPENVEKQAAVMQQQYPQARVETGGSDLAEQVINERTTPQRYQHLQFGEVEALADQGGAGNGRVKVAEVGDASKVHYVKKADLQGRGNSRMIPLKTEGTTPADITRMDSARQEAASQVERRATPRTEQPGFMTRDIKQRLDSLGYTPEQQDAMPRKEKVRLIVEANRRGTGRVDDAEWEAMSPEVKSAVKLLRPTESVKPEPESPAVREGAKPSAPASEDVLRNSQNATGSGIHEVAQILLENPKWKEHVLKELGAGAKPLDNYGSVAEFQAANGDVIKIRHSYAQAEPATLGTQRDGLIIEREKASTPAAEQPSSSKAGSSDIEEITSVYDKVNPKSGVRRVVYRAKIGNDNLDITSVIDPAGTARIENITGPNSAPIQANQLGSRSMFSLKRRLQELHPEVKTLVFERTGTTAGEQGRQRTLAVSKPSPQAEAAKVAEPATREEQEARQMSDTQLKETLDYYQTRLAERRRQIANESAFTIKDGVKSQDEVAIDRQLATEEAELAKNDPEGAERKARNIAALEAEVARRAKPPQSETVAPRETETVKPYEMTREQVEEEFQRKKAEDDNLEAVILGSELAKKYERLQRTANSSTASNERVDAAQAEIERIEASLSERDRNRLYGIGESGPQLDDLRNYRQSLGNLDDHDPQSLAESMRWAVSRVGNETDPTKMTREQQVAYGTLREAARIAHENGWDTQAISREAVRAAGERFADPEDAAFMLDRFLKKESAPTKPQPKQIAAETLPTPVEKGEPTSVPATEGSGQGAVIQPEPSTKPDFVQRAIERKAQRAAEKAEGIEYRRAGIDPTELVDDIIIKGHELYSEKVKPTFDQWSRKLREEFGPKANDHLQRVWAQLQGETTPTSARNASMQADRAEFGLEALPRPATRKDTELLESAKEAHKSDPTEAARIADKVLNGKHTLSDKETLQLDLRTQEVKNTHDRLLKEINDATDDATIASKSADVDALEAEFNKLSEATDKSGTEQGRAFRARRLTINQDMELLPMLARAKKARGRGLTDEERSKITEQAKQIETLTKERDAALDRNKTERIQKEVDKAKRATKRGETREKLDKDAAIIKQNIIAEIARLRAGQSSTTSMAGLGRLDPEGVISRELVKYFRNRAQAHIKLNAEALVDEVHSLVTDLGVDKRAVRDLLSGYSMEVKQQRSAEAKRIDTLRAELQAISKAEDIAAGRRAPHAEGPKLSEAPKQGPKLTDTPKLGPRDTWPARRKAIEKQIAEYERKTAEGDFSKRTHPEPVIHTRESQRLDDKLQRVKSAYNLANERAEPWHWLKTAGSIRKAGLLSGYITHIRNILGTGGYIGFEEARRVPTVLADAAIAPLTGRRTATLSPSATLDGVLHAMTEGLRGAKQILKHGATPEQMERQQLKEVNTGVKAIDTATNFVFRFMSASDHVFYQGSYKRNLIERAQAQAKTEARIDKTLDWRKRAKELADNPSRDMGADAKHDALVSTFNNNNRLSDMVKSARARGGAGGNFAIDLILPFDRTPTNVIARVIEASPAGFAKNAGQLAQALWKREFTAAQQRAFTQTFGRATTGTALMALGAGLAAKGLLTTDDYGTTYLEFRGRKINLSAVAPLGTILSVGAGLYKQWANPDATKRNVAGAITKPLVDQPLLKASSQVSDLVKDPNRNVPQVAAGLATSTIPFSGAVRTLGQAIDPAEKRYPNKTFKEQLMKDIPRVRESLPASHVRLMGSDVNKATKEVERLGVKIKGAVKQEDETAEEFKTREAIQNGNIRTQVENVVALPEFDKASDEDKTAWLKQAAEFASARTREQLPEKPEKKEQKQFPMPQSGFERAYPSDALDRYEKMSAVQRTAVRDSMARKAKVLLGDPRLSAEKKAEFKKRLDALGIAPAATRPRTMREQLSATP